MWSIAQCPAGSVHELAGELGLSETTASVLVRRGYAELYELVRELSGADPLELQGFFATGMLLNVAAAMDLPELLHDESWLKDCLGQAAANGD